MSGRFADGWATLVRNHTNVGQNGAAHETLYFDRIPCAINLEHLGLTERSLTPDLLNVSRVNILAKPARDEIDLF